MDTHDNGRGAAVTPRTREQILADLRATRIDLDCGIDEARAVIAIETVERIENDFQTLADRLEKLIVGYKRSQHSGEAQASAEFDNVLKELGIKGGKK